MVDRFVGAANQGVGHKYTPATERPAERINADRQSKMSSSWGWGLVEV